MPTNILNAQMPSGQPLVEADGTVTQPWLFFFLSLSKRTSASSGSGGSAGGQGISSSQLADDIASVDTTLTTIEGSVTALTAEVTALSAGLVNLEVEIAFSDIPAAPAFPNPFLCALLVG